ncbi:MAG: hypothetical protein HQ564_07040 [Candidatus Saganbacteria bacterium]|nr:hypothetical protein [Candidatus Saganbacteria bacterium]
MKDLLIEIFNNLKRMFGIIDPGTYWNEHFNLNETEKILKYWAGFFVVEEGPGKQISAILTSEQRFFIKTEEDEKETICYGPGNRPKIMDTGQKSGRISLEPTKIIEIASNDGDCFALVIPEKGISDLIAWSKGVDIKE